MRQMGIAAAGYASENRDAIFTLSWKRNSGAGVTGRPYPTIYPDLRTAQDDTTATKLQAGDLMRGLVSNAPNVPSPRFWNWYPHQYYAHLVLRPYLGDTAGPEVDVCPDDLVLQERRQFTADEFVQDNPGEPARRWFAATYSVIPATHSVDSIRTGPAPLDQHQRAFNSGSLPLFGDGAADWNTIRKTSEVTFPSGKVFLMDFLDRHTRKDDFQYNDPAANCPLLFFDGSVVRRRTGDSNPGFQPRDPESPDPTIYSVFRDPDAPTIAYYRWTRGGLKGIDYGGDEINTGQRP